jgi:hypothetical protein
MNTLRSLISGHIPGGDWRAGAPASAEQLRGVSAALSNKARHLLELITSTDWNAECLE